MSDVWGVGIAVYEMLVGQPPFIPEKFNQLSTELYIEEIKSNIMDMALEFPLGFPEIAKDLVLKCLRLNPQERITM